MLTSVCCKSWKEKSTRVYEWRYGFKSAGNILYFLESYNEVHSVAVIAALW